MFSVTASEPARRHRLRVPPVAAVAISVESAAAYIVRSAVCCSALAGSRLGVNQCVAVQSVAGPALPRLTEAGMRLGFFVSGFDVNR